MIPVLDATGQAGKSVLEGAELQALLQAVTTAVANLAPYLDGVEAGLSPLSTEATLAALSAKFPSLGQKAPSGSVSVVQASGSDLATATNQAAMSALLGLIGTRAYGAALTRLAYTGTSSASAAITGTEVLLHNTGTGRVYVKAGATTPTATVNDIPLEAGEKFHLRITSGWQVAALQDSTGGNLNIVPVA